MFLPSIESTCIALTRYSCGVRGDLQMYPLPDPKPGNAPGELG